MLELAAPLWLLLLPVPPLVWWLSARWRRRSAAHDNDAGALIHPLATLIGQLQGERNRMQSMPWPWLLGCLLLIFAMAQPQWLDSPPEASEPGHNMVFAIDVSGSMRAIDYVVDGQRISRLDLLKRSLSHFFEQARQLRVGLVVFADDALTFMPLTSDLALAARLLDQVDNSLAGEKTAIGDAIALSLRRLQGVPNEDDARILVLLTDGINTAGIVSPEAAAQLARERGVRIYTVGFGSDGPVPFPTGPLGETVHAEVPLDEAQMQVLAELTGGAYFRIDQASTMDQVLHHIDRVEKSQIPAPPGLPAKAREWYWLPAIAGLLLILLAERRYRHGIMTP